MARIEIIESVSAKTVRKFHLVPRVEVVAQGLTVGTQQVQYETLHFFQSC